MLLLVVGHVADDISLDPVRPPAEALADAVPRARARHDELHLGIRRPPASS